MKKITSLIAAIISLSGITAFASPLSALPIKLNDIDYTEPAVSDNTVVSISLLTGKPIMLLNGEEVEITAPYVTGEGVTLVPLRVITEAFGAEVNWDSKTQSVNITYSEVNLRLTIGSKAAVINEHAEELESAPELKNETTMVPLRFISETFGAAVDYDSETGVITVTLSDSEEADMIRGMHEKEHIGDSYFEWSMKTPRNMTLSYRGFDGSYLSFYDEYSNELYISVTDAEEYSDINALFQTFLADTSYEAITAAQKTTDKIGNPMLILSTKSSYSKSYYRVILKNEKVYSLTVDSYTDDNSEEVTAAFNDLIALADTFHASVEDDMYDFSDIKDGVRKYENEELKLSFSVPKSYTENSYSYMFNEVEFVSTTKESTGGMSVKIYSKNETANKEIFAQTQHGIDTELFNAETVTVSELGTTAISGTDAVSYSVNGETDDYKFALKKLFFEIGNYVYIINVMDSDDATYQTIVDSFNAEELDFDEVGSILFRRDLMESYTHTYDKYRITLPKYWSNSYFTITDERTNSMMFVPGSMTDKEIEDLIASATDVDENIITEPLNWVETPYGKYPEMTVKTVLENDADYFTVITGKVIGNDVVTFVYTYNELYDSNNLKAEFESIINSTEKIK